MINFTFGKFLEVVVMSECKRLVREEVDLTMLLAVVVTVVAAANVIVLVC